MALDEDNLLRRRPHGTKKNSRGRQVELRCAVRLGSPSRLSEVLASIAGDERVEGNIELFAGAYKISAIVDVQEVG